MATSMDVFDYKGYEIPVDLIRMTGGGPETFDVISRDHMDKLGCYAPVESHHNILEMGCGIGRDAIPLTEILTTGKYYGVDIIGASITWCTRNITPRHSNFRFIHYDVRDQLHNPSGTIETQEIILPIEPGTIDRVIGQSVFTHMAEQDIVHYLREFRRLMRPGGLAVLTCFIVYPEILAATRSNPDRTAFSLTFRHPYSDGCWINNLDYPMGAVAYTPDALTRMVIAGGFHDYRVVHGNWSGALAIPSSCQDTLIVHA